MTKGHRFFLFSALVPVIADEFSATLSNVKKSVSGLIEVISHPDLICTVRLFVSPDVTIK
jgi:hypothetical protein